MQTLFFINYIPGDFLVMITGAILTAGFIANLPFRKTFPPPKPILAKARVLQVEPAGTKNLLPLLKIQLHVMPGKGHNFVTEIETPYSAPAPKPGNTITVRYNPLDLKDIMLLL